MVDSLSALDGSVERLRGLVAGFDSSSLELPAYPSEWSIADVLSHLGSGAVIMKRRVDDIVGGKETDENFNQSVWDEWNSKTPVQQAADTLIADAALLESLESLDEDQRAAFHFSMGPMDLDFGGLVGMRLNEHVVHVWDVEVVADPSATLPELATSVVIDNLDMIARFAGKPTGTVMDIKIRTIDPAREFVVSLGQDAVALRSEGLQGSSDLEIPSESLIRLIYGRLDPDHTPLAVQNGLLHVLRSAFPGF